MDENREERVVVWVTSDRKERWKEYVDDDVTWRDLSDFVRGACEREIQGRETDIDPDAVTTAVETDLSSIQEKIDRLEQQFVNLDSRIETNDDNLRELALDLHEELLPVPSKEKVEEIIGYVSLDANDAPRAVSTPEAWAARFDEDEYTVRRALVRLKREMDDVVRVRTSTGKHRYYRVDPDEAPDLDWDIDDDDLPEGITTENVLKDMMTGTEYVEEFGDREDETKDWSVEDGVRDDE